MICKINLGDNSEEPLELTDLPTLDLHNIWIQLTNPTIQELQATAEKTGINLHFLQLPKQDGPISLRLEPDFTVIDFVIAKELIESKETEPIIMAFTKNFLVTVEKDPDPEILQIVKERMSKTKVDPPAMVTYFIIDEIVSKHFTQLEKIEAITSQIEEEVVEKVKPETLKKIFELKSKLVSFNKTLWYERGLIFNLKTCGEACMPAKPRDMFNTTHEDLTRQIDIVETYREIMSDAINVHLSAVSNRINFSIKSLTVVIFYLTIITTVTSFPNTIATFFGISQFGGTNIFIVATALILSTVLPALWLWRKKWLKLIETND